MKHVACALLLLPLALSAAPAPPSDPADVIRKIYRDHQPWKNRRIDLDAPGVAQRYFDDSLVALFRKEQKEAERLQDMSCLDFDPFLQGQDFDEAGITEPDIRPLARPEQIAYEVTFTGKSESWKNWNVRAVYVFVKTANGWRVHDIEFKDGGSMRKTLSCNHS